MIELNSYYGKTHQGPYLNLNEDDILIDLEANLFAVFDGFGGSNIGDIAVDLVKEKVYSFFTRVTADPDTTMPHYYSPKFLLETNALINAINIAHFTLLEDNSKKQMNDRAGVSCVLGMLSENILSLVSTGNCAAFLYRRGVLSLLNTPDCIAPIGVADQSSSFRTFPLSAIGLYEELNPKVWEINLFEGDKVILASDGIYSSLGFEEMKFFIEQNNQDDYTLIQSLFNGANDKGNLDNQSAIAITL